MTFSLQLPKLKSRNRGSECRFRYADREWTLRRSAETIGDDALVRYAIFLDGRELDPYALVEPAQWERWQRLPYEVPHARLCPANVPSAQLCEHVESILLGFVSHPDKSACFWPQAA